MAVQQGDWRLRHGAAGHLAEVVERLGATVAEELMALAHCRSELPVLADAIGQLREALLAAEHMAAHFDCHDQHAAEEHRRSAPANRPAG